MPRPASSATTRAATLSGRGHAVTLLDAGQLVHSVESGLSYRIGRMLGQGGFGQVFLATRVGRSATVPDTVCVKVSTLLDGWLREAYFGQLLQDHPRAVRVFDTFPVMRSSGHVLYCLALEYAPHGDLSAFLARHSKRWNEAAVRREIAGILHVLGKLHRGQLLHRDLTPLERLRLRRPSPQARRLRHRPPAERSAWRHRAHAQPADGAQRHLRRRGAEVAGARRCVSGGAAPGNAREGRCHASRAHARGAHASTAATI